MAAGYATSLSGPSISSTLLPHKLSTAPHCHQPVTKVLGCLVALPKFLFIMRTIHKVVGTRAGIMGAQGVIEVPQDPRLRRTSCLV